MSLGSWQRDSILHLQPPLHSCEVMLNLVASCACHLSACVHELCLRHFSCVPAPVMKTGESGLTVFRLLTKRGSWVWVQANARLVYKGDRPDCIIACQ